MPNVFIVFCLASLLFILTGLLVYRSPATRKDRYVQTAATVRSRILDQDGALYPVFEFQADGKTNRCKPRFPVSDGFPAQIGDTVPILYCTGSFLGIKTFSALVDDHGASLTKLIRLYHFIGILFIAIGLVLLIPAFLLKK